MSSKPAAKQAAKNAAKTEERGPRKTESEKAEILAFIRKHDAENGRGGQTAAKKEFGVSLLTLGKWIKQAKEKSGDGVSNESGDSQPVNKKAVYKVLAGKGFRFSEVVDYTPTGESEPRIVDADNVLEKLALDFSRSDLLKLDDEKARVISTANKVIVAISLERLLTLTGTKAKN